MKNGITKDELDTIEEFIDKVDKLCFEYKCEIIPCHNGNEEDAYLHIKGREKAINVWYIDGDGRCK